MATTFPSTHHTSTSTTTTTTVSTPEQRLFINSGFLRSLHGKLKIAQIVLCLLAFICVMASGHPNNAMPSANFISFVTICGLLISGILLFLYFINAVVYFTIIPWVFSECIYCAVWTVFCCIGGIVASSFASKYAVGVVAYAASGFFLFVAMCVYGFTAFKLYILHKQGIRLVIVSVQTTTIRSSA